MKNESADLSFMSITPDEPAAFGRVIRNKEGQVTAIVEAKDYDEAEHGPVSGEVNAGIYCIKISSVDSFA